jgi:hypothetical protein
MNNQEAFALMRSALALLGLAYLFFWRYRQFRIDSFRQKIFVLRDELFDEAHRGLIAFDHRAYGILRSTMNGYIRFSHHLTFWHFLVLAIWGRNDDMSSFEQAWKQAISELDEETRQRLISYRNRMDALAIRHVLVGTPEAVILAIPLFIMAVIVLVVTGLIKLVFSKGQQTLDTAGSLREHFKNIDDAALMYGEQVSA